MMKKFLGVIVIVANFVFIGIQLHAQQTMEVHGDTTLHVDRPNIVKLNTLAMAFNNVSLIYERSLMPRLTVGLGLAYKYRGTEPDIFSINSSAILVNMESIKGFSITPEARYYLRTCDPLKLEGFYAGLYTRFTKYTTSARFVYVRTDAPVEAYGADMELDEFGVGLQLGYQMLLNDRFSIDFLFFGPRFSNYTISYDFDEQVSQEFLDDLSDYVDEIVDRFGFDYDVNLETGGSAQAKADFSFANMRFGISVGYAF